MLSLIKPEASWKNTCLVPSEVITAANDVSSRSLCCEGRADADGWEEVVLAVFWIGQLKLLVRVRKTNKIMATYLEVADIVKVEEVRLTVFLARSPNPSPKPTDKAKIRVEDAIEIQSFPHGKRRIAESEDNAGGCTSFSTSPLTTSGKVGSRKTSIPFPGATYVECQLSVCYWRITIHIDLRRIETPITFWCTDTPITFWPLTRITLWPLTRLGMLR